MAASTARGGFYAPIVKASLDMSRPGLLSIPLAPRARVTASAITSREWPSMV
jgi:hypothetical protein